MALTEATCRLDDILSGGILDTLDPVDAVERLAFLLPTQGPIANFVHHNTLHAFDSRDFWDAVREAHATYGSSHAALHRIRGGGLRSRGVRATRDQRLGLDMDRYVVPFMIRWTATYLDQGLANKSMAFSKDGLWPSLGLFVAGSRLPLWPLLRQESQEMLARPVEEALRSCLDIVVPRSLGRGRYLAEVLLTLKGWAGLVRQIEEHPEVLVRPRRVRLREWVALFLLAEVCVLRRFAREEGELRDSDVRRAAVPSGDVDDTWIAQIEEQERQTYGRVLRSLRDGRPRASQVIPFCQTIFCIDDREASMRQYLEQCDRGVETLGAPGFFGLDCQIALPGTQRPIAFCPPMVKPSTLLLTEGATSRADIRTKTWQGRTLSAVSFVVSLFTPSLKARKVRRNEERQVGRVLVASKEQDSDGGMRESTASLRVGYSAEEGAHRVRQLLTTIGLTPERMAPIIAVIGHEASSVNNPYYAAYECGACSGRSGALNAEAFCRLANDLDVRRVLGLQGWTIPKETVFVPWVHDTTTDRFHALQSDLPRSEELSRAILRLERGLQGAAQLNAQFRCRQFDLADKGTSPETAWLHVAGRAHAWYEPRPEYNHSGNFMAVVGPRTVTEGAYVGDGVFLHSYEPSLDEAGGILARILSAVFPVCGGINLEYFFSRMDPEVYGAGNKLPQNVVAMLGVMTGLESDIRTGLPMQMTEIHPPRRLMVVVVQRPDIIDRALDQIGSLRRWYEGRWLHLAAMEWNGSAWAYHQRMREGWRPWTL